LRTVAAPFPALFAIDVAVATMMREAVLWCLCSSLFVEGIKNSIHVVKTVIG